MNISALRKQLGPEIKTVYTDKKPLLIHSYGKAVAAIVPVEALEKIRKYDELLAKERLAVDQDLMTIPSEPRTSMDSLFEEEAPSALPLEVKLLDDERDMPELDETSSLLTTYSQPHIMHAQNPSVRIMQLRNELIEKKESMLVEQVKVFSFMEEIDATMNELENLVSPSGKISG